MHFRQILAVIALFSIILTVPAYCQTEDELIGKFLNKAEKKHIKKVGFVIINGSYGKLANNSDYNKFADGVTPWIASLDGSDSRVDGIYRSKEFFAGFGVMTTPKLAASLGFAYWLKLGSDKTGNYNLSLVNVDDPNDHENFNLKSEVQVYGILGGVDYYLMNPPDRDGALPGLALKVGLSGGYYFASWDVWNGFSGYNLYTETQSVIQGNLTGSAPGGSVRIGAEFPIRLAGLVIETSANYQYLNFTKMKWYNSYDQEHVVIHDADLSRVELDLSGPRAQFGLKRYFSW